MHLNTKRFQIIILPWESWKVYINTEGFPRTGDYKKAVVKWGLAFGFIEIRRWGWIKKSQSVDKG